MPHTRKHVPDLSRAWTQVIHSAEIFAGKRYGGMFFPGVLPVSPGMPLLALRFCSSFPPQKLLRADSSSSRSGTAKPCRLVWKRHTTGFPGQRASQGGFPVWMEKPPGILARTLICWLSCPQRRWRDFHALLRSTSASMTSGAGPIPLRASSTRCSPGSTALHSST